MVDKGSISFASMFNTKLIELVKHHENLYNHESSTYKDMNMKNESWGEIAAELKTDVNLTKKRWRSLRTEYVRNLKHNRKQRYTDQLSYIDPYINNPSLCTTVRTRKATAIKKQELEQTEEESIEQIFELPTQIDNPDHVIYAVESNEDLESQEHEGEIVDDYEFEQMEKHMTANEDYYEEEEEPEEQEVYLTSNENMFKIEDQSVCSEPIIKRPKRNNSELSYAMDQPPNDVIDWDFYRSIANSIKKFSPLAQAQIKGKIYQLVNEADIAHLMSQH